MGALMVLFVFVSLILTALYHSLTSSGVDEYTQKQFYAITILGVVATIGLIFSIFFLINLSIEEWGNY